MECGERGMRCYQAEKKVYGLVIYCNLLQSTRCRAAYLVRESADSLIKLQRLDTHPQALYCFHESSARLQERVCGVMLCVHVIFHSWPLGRKRSLIGH